ncbi:MAG: VCBS repeat-containing protein [bacterium]
MVRSASRLRAPLWVALIAALAAGCDDEAPAAADAARADMSGGFDGLPPVDDAEPPDAADPADLAPDLGGDPCDPSPCGAGERCTPAPDGTAACAPADCDTLECGEFEECRPLPDGGAECVDTRCQNDLACPEDQFCNGTCVADLCLAGERTCAGDVVEQCADNGSGRLGEFVCESPAEGYESTCADDIGGEGACTCRDEWDCPRYLACDGGRCRGTGEAPTCRLDPVPFTESLPAPEVVWGGIAADPTAIGRPFARSAQAVMTPVVANLDDDNGDGLIDARDFPEIVFMTFCDSVFSSNGTVRAMHGGGPRKGRDYFAVHGPHRWQRGEPLPAEDSYDCAEGDIDPTASLAVADLDDPATSDGRPEIIVIHEAGDSGVVVLDNTGAELARGFVDEMPRAGGNPAVAVANVDGRGMAEVIVGPYVITFNRTAEGALEIVDLFGGSLGRGVNGQGAVSCVADVLGDPRPEIIAGSTVYALPDPPEGATRRADCEGNGGAIPPGGAEQQAWCAGELVVRWDATELAPDDDRIQREGFCAVADVLGADRAAPPGPQNPLDGTPEVILIAGGTLQVFDGPTGALREHRVLDAGNNPLGGAPNVDDFDGDGYPEIGSAFRTSYTMIDLQAPTEACAAWPVEFPDGAPPPEGNPPRDPGGACAADRGCNAGAICGQDDRCVCLHNGWRRVTEDESSRVTGSTLFDFNGDGAAEVIYNDECWFRIYDGRTGEVLFKEPSESRTRIEHPIVADVDNDGNAEIVFTVSNESGFCGERDTPLPPPRNGTLASTYNNGLEVWGDPRDRWVSARRIWNQHAYHVTEVTESGAVPLIEPVGWSDLNGRGYNTYRSQPRSQGVAPDLTVRGVQFRSPDAACGTLSNTLELTATIANIGDLRVGPGVVIAFEGTWDATRRPLTGTDGRPLVVELVESLEPGATTRVNGFYDITRNGDDPDRLPDRIDVVADALGDPDFGRERECREDNNTQGAPIVAPDPLPDLRVDAVTALPRICPRGDLSATVSNDSEVAAEGVIVRFYAGNPALGQPLGEVDLGTVGPGETREVSLEADTLPGGRAVVVYAMVDPMARSRSAATATPRSGRVCDRVCHPVMPAFISSTLTGRPV